MVYCKPHSQVAGTRINSAGKKPYSCLGSKRQALPHPYPAASIPHIPELFIDDRFATRMAFKGVTARGNGFDKILRANEQAARCSLKATIDSIPMPALPSAFFRNLEKMIFPKLDQIGMDDRIARDLFRLGYPAWQALNPYLERKAVCHPKMVREVETIHREVIRQGDQTPGDWGRSVNFTRDHAETDIKNSMAPENLLHLLDFIPTPWIILPRARSSLRKGQCRYLPVYLECIDPEGNAVGNRVFARMALELVANYSAKFNMPGSSIVLLKSAVFHAYEALFWKVLRRPPSGFEDCRVFETLFQFLRRHALKWHHATPAMAKAVLRMQTATRLLFPEMPYPDHPDGASRYMITLRHGREELGALLRYFGNLPRLHHRAASDVQGSLILLKALLDLIAEVKLKFQGENCRTRQNVLRFFACLRRILDKGPAHQRLNKTDPVDCPSFIEQKMIRLIDGLRDRLSTAGL